jgi:hypothetical protein
MDGSLGTGGTEGDAAGIPEAGGVEDGGAVTCRPQCREPKPACVHGTCVECYEGDKKCVGNTPATCQSGVWVNGSACAGATSACSNGVCAAAMVTGGIVSVAPLATQSGSIRLVDQAFETAPTICGTVAGKKVCVTGGIRP